MYPYEAKMYTIAQSRVWPEQGYKKPEPEPDYENTVPVPAPVNRIFKNQIRFRFNRNRIFKY